MVDLIRGPKGSIVRLQIRPDPKPGNSESRILALTRDEIKLEEQAAQSTLLAVRDTEQVRRIGVIDIPTFYVDFDARSRGDADYRSTTRDVGRLITELENEGIDGLIIDLRGNGGGALAEATALTGLFIDSGPVVQVRDARGRTQVNRDPSDGLAYAGPLAVIVDRHSASASEIFAGAMQDYNRAIIVGQTTFGKGSVQKFTETENGQIKITDSLYYRVTGEPTQIFGVRPNLEIPSLISSDGLGEDRYENAIRPTRISDSGYSANDELNMDIYLTKHEKRPVSYTHLTLPTKRIV